MNDYPEHLKPVFHRDLFEFEPFEHWWKRVRDNFSGVPACVAEQWIHRHWGESPYDWVRSENYEFERVDIPADDIATIRVDLAEGWGEHERAEEHGRLLREQQPDSWLVRYMIDNKTPPRPLILMDNRDGHLGEEGRKNLPAGLLLFEGHRRFILSAALQREGSLISPIPTWLMRRRRLV